MKDIKEGDIKEGREHAKEERKDIKEGRKNVKDGRTVVDPLFTRC